MKHATEYRDGRVAGRIAQRIAAEAAAGTVYRFMEFCGGHTHAISRYGLEDLLPGTVRLVHGPGCPVCVLPVGRIDTALELAAQPGVTLCTYGDLMRVPGSGGASLLRAKAAGADVRMIYCALDAVAIARAEPHREVVLFAIGFETTTPPTARSVRLAQHLSLKNFTVFCNHVLTPAAIQNILESPALRSLEPVRLDGFIGPAHVSTIIGSEPYTFFAEEFAQPVVISGFEPLDVLQSVLMLVRQVNDGRHEVENQYGRAVRVAGNELAKGEVAEVFELRKSFEWRGLGEVPYSALRLKATYGAFDAERRFTLRARAAREVPGCQCGAVLRGAKEPLECRLFGTVCTPESPMGSCMVSPEGACSAYWTYKRFRTRARREHDA